MINLTSHGLNIGYRSKGAENVLLRDLHLELSPGQLICLVGRNGTGKSTLIRTLTGLQTALAGSIEIAGKPVAVMGLKEKARLLSVVLTHNTISGLMNVREVVSLGRYPHTNWFASFTENDQRAVDEALELTGMGEMENAYYDQLSDGQRQKVILSRAVAQDTPLIILDEPTNHLDIGNKAEILQLLKFLAHNKDKTILVSTHDLDLALQMADILWVIADGQLHIGAPEELLLKNVLDHAFPYSGIDLFSGRIVKPATGIAVFVAGSSFESEITRSALRRLDFKLVEDPSDSELVIELAGGKWYLRSQQKTDIASDITGFLEILGGIRAKS